MAYTTKELENTLKLINSLKLAQRAEIFKDGTQDNIIEQLYTDPLPNNSVFNQIVQDDTVFLVGRKGTGKSTIFARGQEHIRKQKNHISAYIDVKSLYGKSLAQDLNTNNLNTQNLLLYQNFINTILNELIIEISKNLEKKSILFKIFNSTEKFDEAKEKLANILTNLKSPEFIDTTLIVERSNTEKDFTSAENKDISNLSLNLSQVPSLDISDENQNKTTTSEERIKSFSNYLLRHFSIKEYMESISEILKDLKIYKVHIFLDDFSEIEFEAQQIFVNTILAPLNNWSDKFYRFKVGAYPKRIFYGDIEKGKVTIINLDFYDLYKVKDLPELEVKAIDFLERLLSIRFQYYLKKDFEFLFQIDSKNDWDSFKKELFYCSMNVPRVLGHILYYCYQTNLVFGKKITKSLIEEASVKYYENQISYYFDKNNFLKEAFEESMNRFTQQSLMKKIVDTSKSLKLKLAADATELFKDLKGQIPTSHFFINKENEKFLYSLELNYFLTKYYEQSDRDGKAISIYAINYGLCSSNNILFGRPEGHSKYRKYYISRYFNCDSIITEFLNGQKEYVCSNCHTSYNLCEYETLEKINMLCYKGCKENNLIQEKFIYANLYTGNKVDKKLLLSEIDLDILNIIFKNSEDYMYASDIALESDCTYQLISQRTSKLIEKDLILKIKETGRSAYKLSKKAIDIYFQ